MSATPETYNPETKDTLALVQQAAALSMVFDLSEVELVMQKTATSTRPEVAIEVRVKR